MLPARVLALSPLAMLAACGGGGGGGAGTPPPPASPITGQADVITAPAGQGPATGNLLANDGVSGGASATVVAVAVQGGASGTIGQPLQGMLGQLTVQSNGAFTYTPGSGSATYTALAAGQTATETFTYTPAAGGVNGTPQTLTITVTGINDAPVPTADDGGTIAAGSATAATGNVLANDRDPDTGAQLSVVDVRAAGAQGSQSVEFQNHAAATALPSVVGTYGTLTMRNDGSYEYVIDAADPDTMALTPGQTVEERFVYSVSDGTVSSSGTLSFTVTGVNDAPIAVADTNAVTEDASTTVVSGNVRANDSDPDGTARDQLTIVGVSHALTGEGIVGLEFYGKYGSIRLNADGSYTYELDNADPDTQALRSGETADEIFTYTIRDPEGASRTATLTIGVSGNSDLAAVDDSIGIAEDGAALTVYGNVLLNDVSPNAGSTLTVTQLNGLDLILDPDPDAGAGPGERGLYRSLDGIYGRLTIRANGSFYYSIDNNDPDTNGLRQGQSGIDSFTYTFRDSFGLTATATIKVTVSGADEPIVPTAVEDRLVFTEDSATTTLTGSVFANDILLNDGTSRVTSLLSGWSLGNAFQTTYGSFLLRQDGTFTVSIDNHDPDVSRLTASQTAEFVQEFIIRHEASQNSYLGRVVVVIQGADDAPYAAADTAYVPEDSGVAVVTGNVLANDADPDQGSTLTLASVNGLASNIGQAITGTYGTFTISANGSYTYTLDNGRAATNALAAGQTATDTITVTIADNTGMTSSSVLTVNITGADDAPTVSAPSSLSLALATSTQPFASMVIADPEGAAMTVRVDALPATGNVTTSDGSVVTVGQVLDAATFAQLIYVTPTLIGSAGSFGFTVIDPAGATVARSVPITIGAGPGDAVGTAAGDIITVGSSQSRAFGFGGGDIVTLAMRGSGPKFLDGGADVDRIEYNYAELPGTTGIMLDLRSVRAGWGGFAGDTVIGFESVIGSSRSDVIVLGADGRKASGHSGDDILVTEGDAGLDGGDGNDLLVYRGTLRGNHLGLPTDIGGEGGSGDDVHVVLDGSQVRLTDVSGRNSVIVDAGYDRGQPTLSVDLVIVSAYNDGNNLIDLSDLRDGSGALLTFAELQNHAVATASGVRITLDGWQTSAGKPVTGTIEIEELIDRSSGIAGAAIDPSMFLFDGGEDWVGRLPLDLVGYEPQATAAGGAGGSGPDTLVGTAGADVLQGDGGNDILYGNGGADTLDGGSGDDLADYRASASAVTVDLAAGTGTGGDAEGDTLISIERLRGSALGDSLNAGTVAAVLDGRGGNDVLVGGIGDVRLLGGDGNDSLAAGGGNDTLFGNDGDDSFTPGAGADNITGGGGFDTVSYAAATVGVVVDTLPGFPASRYGQAGSTGIWAGSNGAVGDVIGIDVERIIGSAFNDIVWGTLANDTLEGGAGDDSLIGQNGNDTLIGGGGYNHLRGGQGADVMIGGDDGNAFYDAYGNDRFQGGLGFDIVSYDGASAGITVTASGVSGDIFISIERVIGTAHVDGFTGGAGNDDFVGGAGDDSLSGLGGADVLIGGLGADSITGGDGNDTIVVKDGDLINAGIGDDHVVLVDGTPGATATVTLGNGADVVILDRDLVISPAGAGPTYRISVVDFSHSDGDRIDLTRLRDAGGNILDLQDIIDHSSSNGSDTTVMLDGFTLSDGQAVFGFIGFKGIASASALVAGDFIFTSGVDWRADIPALGDIV